MKHGAARFACGLLAAIVLAVPVTPVRAEGTPSSQEEARQQLEALQRDIASLQARLADSRAEHRSHQENLRALDLRLQETTRALRELEAQRAGHQGRLTALEGERDAERARVRQHEAELAVQVVATYKLARQSRVKLVLNQDDPLRLARLLAYHDHINRFRANQIAALRSALARLERLHRDMAAEIVRLDEVHRAEQESLAIQQHQRAERETLLTELERRIGGEAQRLAELERNRADLEELVAQLGNALADIPSDLGRQTDLKERKGRLAMPVKARVRHAFGQNRAAGLRWQGWLIDAPAGTEVRSIAHGRVAFADWFRGYGLMLIIDHGEGFMSLYGYNESLLWDVGDWVEPGAVIATVGSGPGGERGLYFELRRDGKAVDPAAWLER